MRASAIGQSTMKVVVYSGLLSNSVERPICLCLRSTYMPVRLASRGRPYWTGKGISSGTKLPSARSRVNHQNVAMKSGDLPTTKGEPGMGVSSPVAALSWKPVTVPAVPLRI